MWRVYAAVAAMCAGASGAEPPGQRPHIILIVADDLGWNDVGFHGMDQVPTPNVDALAASGVALMRHYVTPICTPSRAALFTGKYPIHTGMQHGVLYGAEPRGLPLSEKLLPQYLRELGYRTHLVGKWHLGSFSKDYLPTNRGFDSHLGFWTGKIDMFDHTNMEQGSWGFDFRRGFEVAHDLFGKYATDVYTEEAVKIIRNHDAVSAPLFLTVAHSAVHSGNPSEPLRAPLALLDAFPQINDTNRRRFAGMLTKLDESVGLVVEALERTGMLNQSIILFTTDNGGPAAGFNDNAASNYPLRGTKNTLWEGGVRGAALLWSPLLQQHSRVSHQTVHLVDWLPTLHRAAGGNTSVLEAANIDGISQWDALSSGAGSPRAHTPTLINIDPVGGTAALVHTHWKLVSGTNYEGKWDGWYGPAGRDAGFAPRAVLGSRAGRAANRLGLMPTEERLLALRAEATVVCPAGPTRECRPLRAACLFNIATDPCERNNLATQYPEKLQELLATLAKFNSTAVPPNNAALDPAGDPARWGRVFTNFRDYRPPTAGPCL